MTVAVRKRRAKPMGIQPLINLGLVKGHLIVGFVFLIVAMLMGIFYSLQLNNLYPFPGIEFLSPGRVRMVHTNGVAYGFIVNVYLGNTISTFCLIQAISWSIINLILSSSSLLPLFFFSSSYLLLLLFLFSPSLLILMHLFILIDTLTTNDAKITLCKMILPKSN